MRVDLPPGVRRLFRLPLRTRGAAYRDADDELRALIAIRVEHLVARGMSPEDARAEAMRRLGVPLDDARQQLHGSAHRRERRLRLGEFLDSVAQDIQFVARSMRRNVGLSLAVIATLALTIGMTTGLFTLVEAAMLRPRVDHDQKAFFRVFVAYQTDSDRFPKPGAVSMADFVAYRRGATSARAMTAHFKVTAPLDATSSVNSRLLAVTCDFFSVYAPPPPLLGRPLQPTDCERAERVIVLGEAAWRQRYGADPSIVGKTIRLNDRAVMVVGVLPAYDGQFDRIEAWLPYTTTTALGLGANLDADPTQAVLTIDGFARPGRARRDVAAEVAAAAAQQDRLSPKRHSRVLVTNGALIEAPAIRPLMIAALSIIVLLLGFVVVIACTNVTSLLLSRAEARRQEVAIRLAIGASRSRLLRLLLTETAVLALLAAVGGVWFAYAIPPVVARMLVGQPAGWSLHPDWLAFAWLALATLLAGAAAGLAPALGALRTSLVDGLKPAGSSMRHGKPRRAAYGRLVTVQLALSFVLLAGGYLFYRSYQRLAALDVGHATRDLLTVSLADRDHSTLHVGASLRTMVPARLGTTAGVQRVAFATALPSAAPPAGSGVTVNRVRRLATEIETSAAFFETAGIHVVEGQSYGDAQPACVSRGCSVVLSQEMARQLFGQRDPLGATLRSDSGVVMRVLGVASDVKSATGQPGPLPIIYEPWDPAPEHAGYMAVVRFSGRPDEVAAAVARALRQALPDASVIVQNVQSLIDRSTEIQRQLATIISAFALLALLLALIGIHGVVSFSVRRHTKELGLRIALGATARDICVVVARAYAGPIVAGMVGGLLIAMPTAVFVQRGLAMVPIVDRGNAVSFAVAALAMLVLIVFAIAGPARRAVVISPLTALREE